MIDTAVYISASFSCQNRRCYHLQENLHEIAGGIFIGTAGVKTGVLTFE